MVKVKICGITNLVDALAAVEAGASALGFNFWEHSTRFIPPQEARRIIESLPKNVLSVGVFVNADKPEEVERIAKKAHVAAIQLHGDESPAYCRSLREYYVIKSLRVRDDFKPEYAAEFDADAILLDAFSLKARGGTGQIFDWSMAVKTKEFARQLFLAGGLTPENVADAIQTVQPYAVDVCSGVEASPGCKDLARLLAFIKSATLSRQL